MKILVVVFCYSLIASSACATDEVLYDTVDVRWPNGNSKEYYTRCRHTGFEDDFHPHGQYSAFYESGPLREQGNYQWNIKTGAWMKWDENGNRSEDLNYFNGAKTGLYIEWHVDKSIKTFGYYNNNEKNGLWIHRKLGGDLNHPEMSIDSVKYYHNDTLLVVLEGNQGKWLHPSYTFYNSEYDLWIKWKRRTGANSLVNYSYFFIGKKVDGKKQGKWIKRAANGEIIEIVYYKNGSPMRIDDLLE